MEKFWGEFLRTIKERTKPKDFQTWFQHLTLIEISPEILHIEVPKKFFADWLTENYLPLIQSVTFDLTSFKPDLKFKVNDQKENISFQESNKPEKNYHIPKNINLQYTFENFVLGASNQFAQAACMAVANKPGMTYNPLFIYGETGLGKTHLLHAIFHLCLKNNNQLKVCYEHSEKFINEMINSIRLDRMPSFRNKYRNLDVLLLDDIQFIAGKKRTQEEFFHTFNSLYEIKKQIVLTSDIIPMEIDDLDDRLRTRFECGLTTDIQKPETETKVVILKAKAKENKINLSNEVAFLLATNVKSSVRELQGLLIKLIAHSSFSGKPITPEFTKEVLKGYIIIDNNTIKPKEILDVVSKSFNMKVSDLKGKKRNKNIVLARQISMFILKKETNLSYPEIGQFLGGKDHSTVIHSVKKITSKIETDEDIKKTVDTLLKKF